MFETLTGRFEAVFGKLKGRGKLSAADVDSAMREIRMALLEADVNFDVVKSLTGRIRARALDKELSKALNPSQQVVKIVLAELTASLGGEPIRITYSPKPPTVVLFAGLQGTGKTTNAVKLAQWFLRQGRHPLLVGADLQRPAAVEQLRTLAHTVNVPVYSEPTNPVKVVSKARSVAVSSGRDVVIVDTAGRLAVDLNMMTQVSEISNVVKPDFTFLVVDAMTGQDAVTVAKSFNDVLALDGVILTKLDGDARGGAALSVKEVVGKPIAFASTGEKLDDFEMFYPDRLASRILGMGDIETLIDKAETVFEAEEATDTASRMAEGTFTLDEFLNLMQQVQQMGSLSGLLSMMPGLGRQMRDVEIDDRQISRVQGIIHSMTLEERAKPQMIDMSRRERIAKGAGCLPADVKNLVMQFSQMSVVMQNMMGSKSGKRHGRRGKGVKQSKNLRRGASRSYSGKSLHKEKVSGSRRSGRVTPKGTRRGGRVTPSRVTPKGTKATSGGELLLPNGMFPGGEWPIGGGGIG